MNLPGKSPTGSSHKVPSPKGTIDGIQSNEMNRLPVVKAGADLHLVSRIQSPAEIEEISLRIAGDVSSANRQCIFAIPEVFDVAVLARNRSGRVRNNT